VPRVDLRDPMDRKRRLVARATGVVCMLPAAAHANSGPPAIHPKILEASLPAPPPAPIAVVATSSPT
jgi:hypothetical protein